MKTRKYWFKFDLSMKDPHPIGTLMGCGVTASSKEEALELLTERVFRYQPMPSIKKCIEDVEMSELDTKHVLPNIGDSSQRGIWFPLGYDAVDDLKRLG
jgi:hypothetical protein